MQVINQQRDIINEVFATLMLDPVGNTITTIIGGTLDFAFNKIPVRQFLSTFGVPGKIVSAFVHGQTSLLLDNYFSYAYQLKYMGDYVDNKTKETVTN